MEKITSVAGLKKAIALLEAEQTVKLQRLKEQFYPLCENLRPVNLLKSTLNDINSSSILIDNILGTFLGLATGYLSKRLLVGASVNRVRRLFGAILQLGVTNVVARHGNAIQSYSRYLLKQIFRRKELVSS
jgi:hypothetical protein